MTSILSGIKVIEMGHWVAVPAAGVMLADWGAEVIKVEPLKGDAQRYQFPLRKDLTIDTEAINIRFEVHNRNKRGVALDLSKKAGREALYELIKQADAFISNYELSTLKKFGLDYESLKKINPGLVYGILTGYGTRGPDKDERGFDLTSAWARSGFQHLLVDGDSAPPIAPVACMDRMAGINVVAGVLAGLLGRQTTGQGQQIEFSLYQTGVWSLAGDLQLAISGYRSPNESRKSRINPLVNTYRTGDNKWIVLSMSELHAHWSDFCMAIDMPELLKDDRFPPDKPEIFVKHREEAIRIFDSVFLKHTLDEWVSILKEHNCIFSRIWTPAEVVRDPQAIENDFFLEAEYFGLGKKKLLSTPVRFVDDPVTVRNNAPEIGQDTEEVLLEMGYSWDAIAQLKEDGAIR